MKDRIKEYMDYKSISAGELATLLEVQRSNISHVLNGRNKPGASFIEKLLLSFPDLNARWLMTGEGEMIILNTLSVPVVNQLKTQPEKSTETKRNNDVIPEDRRAIEKIVVLYSDGTFTDYDKKRL